MRLASDMPGKASEWQSVTTQRKCTDSEPDAMERQAGERATPQRKREESLDCDEVVASRYALEKLGNALELLGWVMDLLSFAKDLPDNELQRTCPEVRRKSFAVIGKGLASLRHE